MTLSLAAFPAAQTPAPDESVEALFRGLENAEYPDGIDAYRRRLAQLESSIDKSDPRQLERYQRLACWYQQDEGVQATEAAIAQATLWLQQAQQAGRLVAESDFTLCRGWFREWSGDYAGARADYERALSLAEASEDRRMLADALGSRAELLALQGDLGQALQDFQAAHHIFHSLGIRYWSTYYLSMIANTYRRMGDFEQARMILEDVVDSYLKRGDELGAEDSRYMLALTLDELGEHERAEAILLNQLSQARQEEDTAGELNMLISLADNRLRAGDPAAADTFLMQAEPVLSSTFNHNAKALWHLFKAGVLMKEQRAELALGHIEQAELPLQEQDNLRYLAWVQRLKADALAATGQWQTAFEALQAYQHTQSELANRLREQASTRMRVEFDTARKEAENETLRAETEAQNARLRNLEERRQLQGLVFVLSAILLVLLGVWAVKQWRRSRKMQYLALTDELTGLPNRRAVYTHGDDTLARCLADEAPFTILVFDIDYFKRINDTWGHDVGDRVLEVVASVANTVFRKGDLVGRTGGEEFLAILPGADEGQAVEVAQRLCRHIEDADLRAVADDLKVTVSVGVARYDESDLSFSRLIQRADTALYAAKNAGRNRVELAASEHRPSAYQYR